jgi:hypothetical protein
MFSCYYQPGQVPLSQPEALIPSSTAFAPRQLFTSLEVEFKGMTFIEMPYINKWSRNTQDTQKTYFSSMTEDEKVKMAISSSFFKNATRIDQELKKLFPPEVLEGLSMKLHEWFVAALKDLCSTELFYTFINSITIIQPATTIEYIDALPFPLKAATLSPGAFPVYNECQPSKEQDKLKPDEFFTPLVEEFNGMSFIENSYITKWTTKIQKLDVESLTDTEKAKRDLVFSFFKSAERINEQLRRLFSPFVLEELSLKLNQWLVGTLKDPSLSTLFYEFTSNIEKIEQATTANYIDNLPFPPSPTKQEAKNTYLLPNEFSDEILSEVNHIPTEIPHSEIALRMDLRNLVTFTIDPASAKCLEDAISITKTNENKYHVYVHIVDVTHYVKANSALDEAAQMRFYNHSLKAGAKMLPGRIKNLICNFSPEQSRLAVTVSMVFDERALLHTYSIKRSVIKSKAQLTYSEAQAIIDKRKESPFQEPLQWLVKLTKYLHEKRTKIASVNRDKISELVIEEFMIKTNELVGIELRRRDILISHPIHPPQEADIESLQAEMGKLSLSQKSTPQGTGSGSCHFTSPNRFYTALTVHRALFEKASS